MKTQHKAAQAIDRQLARYREMRNFDVTAEPRGVGGDAKESLGPMPFVVQKHAASRLHYDFRLGWHGVLKSWAVTKGPSCNPAEKRLAVQVEDHPMEYGGFEGTIPKGQYGGGTVMLWDQGDWSTDDDVDAGLREGHLKFELRGTKLKGKWALVRMGGRAARSERPSWLLIKEHDRYACTEKDVPITDKEQRSAVTQRRMEEIAESGDHLWNSNKSESRENPSGRREQRKSRPKPANRRSDAGVASVTHPEKMLDKTSGLTKGLLAEYFDAVAEHMLPHIADRPLSVVRCPNGSDKPCFFQKHVGSGTPEGVGSVSIPNRKTGKAEDYLTVDSARGLLGLAQLGVLEIHPWGSRNEALEKADRIVIDLDPDPSIQWKTLAASAVEVRDRLAKLRLKSFLKSTGGKGLHVVVPIVPDHEWKVVKDFVHRFVLAMEQDTPDLYVTKMAKASRKNRIFLDYLRNDREATSIAPFSTRARKGAPVAMPLEWSATKDGKMPQFFAAEFRKWSRELEKAPWADMRRVKQRLSAQTLAKVRDR
jgi:bifunctional non-homologous end joining protein LigD